MNATRFEPPDDMRPLFARIESVARAADMHVYAVGGTVRDVLVGRPLRDLDIAVTGDPMPFARTLAMELDGHFVELDDENGVARIVLKQPHGTLHHIDVAGLRGPLAEDLARRDFTIGAMAAPLTGGSLIDPLGGAADLAAGVVRMTSPAAFEADPLRLLRAPRIAAELRFTIDAETSREIRTRAHDLRRSAAERQRDELAHIFALPDAHGGLCTLDALRLLDVMLPELAAGRGVSQPPDYHAFDVFEHSLRTVEAMDVILDRGAGGPAWLAETVWRAFASYEAELRAYLDAELSEGRRRAALLKLAALLHDIGKPATRTVDAAGRIRFFGHAEAGAAIARDVLRRLRFSAREVDFVSALVAQHLRPVQLAQVGQVPSKRALYRFARALGDALPAVLLLALADAAASRGFPPAGSGLTPDGWARHAAYMNSLLVRSREQAAIMRAPRLLTGTDIMEQLGIPEGPLVGRLLEAVREAQAVGDVTDREGALALARRIARSENPGKQADGVERS